VEWQTTTTILHQLRDYENSAAWTRLVDRFREPIIQFARQSGVSIDRAEDVAQETLLAFAEAYRGGDARIANLPHGEMERRALDKQSLTTIWENQWRQFVLDQCLLKLRQEMEPVTYRAFEMVVRDAMSPGEAAASLGVPVKSVYNAKHRGLKRIRQLQSEFESVNGEP